MLLYTQTQSDEYRGEGNSFHGPGSRDSKKAQMKYTLRLLRALVFTNNFVLIQDLCDQGVMSQLLRESCGCNFQKIYFTSLFSFTFNVAFIWIRGEIKADDFRLCSTAVSGKT